ncbi:MAG: lipoyl synthase [Planctomycetes bacterium]|nr:lipoyl synthase [Planctomycetota bacterium]
MTPATQLDEPPGSPGAGLRPLPVLPAAARGRGPSKHPSWIKTRFSANDRYRFLKGVLREKGLHTVCEEAECPNVGECWAHGTATFMLLGDTCTRGCTFCAVGKGRPAPLDPGEPEHVAEVVEALKLDYAVLTSVDRDDLPDEGAGHFAATVRAIRRRLPDCRVEALVPDFHARRELIEAVVLSPLFVFAHNVETVPRLYVRVRPGSDYRRSLRVLELAKAVRPEIITKSSLMLGLGESREELLQVFRDLRDHRCDILTLGQYLRPTADQVEVFRYVPPGEFQDLEAEARALGFRHVVSGPLVRSSYHAWEVHGKLRSGG